MEERTFILGPFINLQTMFLLFVRGKAIHRYFYFSPNYEALKI